MDAHALSFIQDLAIIMLIAGIMTVLCHRFKQPVVLGYIVAGIIIGPFTPPFSLIHNTSTIQTLAELGVIFLMFYLGLEFNLHKLKSVGVASIIAAFSEIILMMFIGYEIGVLLGWSTMNSLFLGATLSISSTTIILKAFEEVGIKKAKFAQLVFGILIIEDIFAIAILALLSGLDVAGTVKISEMLITTIKLFSFLVTSLILGILLIPKLLNYIAKFNNNEMLLIAVIGLCFGFCLLTVKLNYSVALGAFVIGAIIAESRQLHRIEQLIIPLRDMFSAIFFVSIGLLFNPAILVKYALPILVITIAVVIGKVLTGSLGVFISGRDPKTAVRVGMSLAQIGEFSFIIASLGMTLQVTSDFLFPIVVAVSAITTFLTPYLIKYSDSLTKKIDLIIPDKISNVFKWYALWIQNIRIESDKTLLTKSNLIQIIINVFVVMAIFFSGAYLSTTAIGTYLSRLTNPLTQKTIIWSLTLFISLPFLLAIYRKVKTLSILLAEGDVEKSINQRFNLTIRRIISEVIPILSLIGILLLVSALSAIILPPFELLGIVSIFFLGLVIILYSSFNKLHAKLKNKLVESINKTPHD